MEIKCLEYVDKTELQAKYALAEALWSKLVEQGVRSRSQGRIEVFLFAANDSAAAAFTTGWAEDGWVNEIEPVEDGSGRIRIKLISDLVYLTREAFIDLTGIMMVAALGHDVVFDGFQVDVSAVRQRPWWQFW